MLDQFCAHFERRKFFKDASVFSIKEFMKKLFAIACAALAPCLAMATPVGTVLNINASQHWIQTHLEPEWGGFRWEPYSVNLDAGSYTVTPVAKINQYPGADYSAWIIGDYFGQTKWTPVYQVALSQTDVRMFGTEVAFKDNFNDEASAFAAAEVGTFSLAAAQTVYFGFSDSTYADNSGGVSLLLSKVNSVPEPQTYAMVLAGLALLGWRSRRDKPTSRV